MSTLSIWKRQRRVNLIACIVILILVVLLYKSSNKTGYYEGSDSLVPIPASKSSDCNCGSVYDYSSEVDTYTDCQQYLLDSKHQAPHSEKISWAMSVSNSTIPWVYAITPTYKRPTQLLDLTCLCQTLMNVRNAVWIVIEDSPYKTRIVSDLLQRCKVQSVHLQIQDPVEWPKPSGRGIPQRIAGLNWIRKHCNFFQNCSGALYFLDDDNKYDVRLFEHIRMTNLVSVWPVAFSGGMLVEGPICKDGRVDEWHTGYAPTRNFPIDMAGFAVNVEVFLSSPDAVLGYKPHSTVDKAEGGWQETRFIENFVKDRNDPQLECRGSEIDILVWHSRSVRPRLLRNSKNSYGLNI